MSARAGGTVVKVHVDNNQMVEAGAVLFEIDRLDYEVALQKAKADLAEAEAKLSEDSVGVPVTRTATSSRMSAAQAAVTEVHASVAAAEKQVEAAGARKATAAPMVKAAKANADRAAADFQRMKTLLAKDEISRRRYDAAFAAAEATQAQWEAAQAEVEEAERGVAVARSLLEHERARLPRAEAEVKAAELNLERTVVRAPARGIVGQKNLESGQIIAPGQPVLAVVATNEVWVVANYKENQMAQMRPGQRAELEVDAFGGEKLHGTVQSIAGATGARFSLMPPENATGN